MSLYRKIVYPILGCFDPEWVHETTLGALEKVQQHFPAALRWLAGPLPPDPIRVAGIEFPNRLGLAAGFDKEARVARGLSLLGFGHLELGTVTPLPQPGNPKPRIFRLRKDHALINRLGFPSSGISGVQPRLRELRGRLETEQSRCVIGVSLGKQKDTPLAAAVDDYRAVMTGVYRHSDYLAVNISSPNTPGLRELQGRNYLAQLLGELRLHGEALATRYHLEPRPIFVKLAPDLEASDLIEMLDVVLEQRMDGVIATNTTLSREGLVSRCRNQQGGLSGAPLRERSSAIVRTIRAHVGSLPIIGVGGVRSPREFREKLDAGADLVQIYTGLVTEGPTLPGRIVRDRPPLPIPSLLAASS